MSRRPRPLDVAIVGMACRFAGAGDLFHFWDDILAARSSIRDVPAGRWDASVFHDPGSSDPGRVSGRRGGYLDEPIPFEPASFGIMPRTVEGGEPEQFLVLDAARSALEDAGLLDRLPDRRRVEVVIGRGNYFNRGNLTRLQHGRILEQTLAILRSLHPEWTESDLDALRRDLRSTLPPFDGSTIPGQLTNATAGRIADRFDLAGASFVVDAASASALVALDLGARSLIERRADLALIGAVYLEADVDFPLVFSRLGALSKSGECRPFADDADGLVPGEGAGVVVLKRLRDAERDGDRVYAVLKGLGLSSDGRGAGLAAPSARGHRLAMKRAYQRSGIDPATVGYVEAHGLGVRAADRAEMKALRATFPEPEDGSDRVLGHNSSLIGHAMPAAGMAGLIKAALCLHHRVLPPTPGADRRHRALDGSGFSRNVSSRPWIAPAHGARRAGVNAFGFAGVNAHAILEEYAASADGVTPGAMLAWPTEAVLLAAEDRPALAARSRWLAGRLRERPAVALKDVAATLASEAVAAPGGARLGLVVESVGDLIERLEGVATRLETPSCRSIRDARGAYYWESPAGREGGMAFLFPGEGSQYPGMLADLCLHFPEVRARFDTSDRLARESGAIAPPSAGLFGPAGDDASLWETGTAVNVVLSSQWALYTLLTRLGLRPRAVAGHSSGEFLALAAAGAIRVDRDLEERLNRLASVFASVEASGAVPPARLVGAATSRDRIESMLEGLGGVVSIVADNCPHQVVLAGPEEAVGVVVTRLRGAGVPSEDLPFSRAYHTPAFAPALGPVREFFEGMEFRPPGTPLYSCCSMRPFPPQIGAMRSLAISQWTRPVEFRRTIEAMHDDGIRLFVDVGARGNLAGFVEDTLRGRSAFSVAANLPRRSGITQVNHVVASLFAQGVELTPGFLFARRRPGHVDFEAPPPVAQPSGSLVVGFPEMRLSPEVTARFREKEGMTRAPEPRGSDGPEPIAAGSEPVGWSAPTNLNARGTEGDGVPSPPSEDRFRPLAERDESMLAYLETMDQFLRAQRSVMEQFLGVEESRHDFAPAPVPSLGPWAGEVRRIEPGRSVEAILRLDAQGDPVAEHHTFGGRRVSAVDPGRKGLPVLPFTVMAEMLAQVASRLFPGRVVVGLREVRARRWIRYEAEPTSLEVVAEADPQNPGHVRAALYNRGGSGAGDGPAVEGIVVFGDRREEPAPPASPPLIRPEASRFDAHSMYAEQWLFHGPALRAVSEVGRVDDGGIDGMLRVLPRKGLHRSPESPAPLTDPIVLDAFTHLLGLWGLDRLSEGDVVFPLRLGRLDILGDDPPEGADCPCLIRVRAIERFKLTVDAEILRPDGRVWMRLTDWDDWRFYWPSRYRDVFRLPEQILLGEPLALPGETDAIAVWLEPPGDMGRPVWRDVLEQIQLSPSERSGPLRPEGHDGRRTLRLWGRIAAKEAARRLWLRRGERSVFPADLSILPDAMGRPVLNRDDDPGRHDFPALSIAHTEGVAVAIATEDPRAKVGIDVERVVDRAPSFESAAFSASERSLLDRMSGPRAERIARLWCAKEAAAKATGRALAAGPSSVEAIAQEGGRIEVRLGPGLAEVCPDLAKAPLSVFTERRGGYVWAWTVTKAPARGDRDRRTQLSEARG